MEKQEYIILDVFTAECYAGVGLSVEQAIQHIEENIGDEKYTIVTKDNYDDIMELSDSEQDGRYIIIAPINWVDNVDNADLIIYPAWEKSALYGEVAEYTEDLLNSDILDNPDRPVNLISSNESED